MLSGDDALRRIEEFQALYRRDERDRTGLHVIEGARFVHEAVRTRTRIVSGVVSPVMLDAGGRAAADRMRRVAPVDAVTPRTFRRISRADEPSGIAAIVRQRWRQPPRLPRGEPGLWVAFGAIRAPGNLGTTLRTAVAAGARGALFLHDSADPFDPTAVRASMGAVLSLPLVRMDVQHLRAWARRTGAVVVGSSANGGRDIDRMPRAERLVVMLGCERRGMSRAQRRACDVTVRIPMAPGVSSLNVAVAAGLLLFAARTGAVGR